MGTDAADPSTCWTQRYQQFPSSNSSFRAGAGAGLVLVEFHHQTIAGPLQALKHDCRNKSPHGPGTS